MIPPTTVWKVVELGQLCLQFGRVNRVTYHEDGRRLESDTDHTVMLGILACAFAEQYAPHLDLGLVAQFALVHDFVEVYAGDTNTLKASAGTAAVKEQREAAALVKLKAQFDSALPWLTKAIERYDALNTPEARFIKTLDKVLPKITHALNRGAALREHGVAPSDLPNINGKQYQKIKESYGADQAAALALYQGVHQYLCQELARNEKE